MTGQYGVRAFVNSLYTWEGSVGCSTVLWISNIVMIKHDS